MVRKILNVIIISKKVNTLNIKYKTKTTGWRALILFEFEMLVFEIQSIFYINWLCEMLLNYGIDKIDNEI